MLTLGRGLEQEPNATAATAQVLGALPWVMDGVLPSSTDVDWYRFTLSDVLGLALETYLVTVGCRCIKPGAQPLGCSATLQRGRHWWLLEPGSRETLTVIKKSSDASPPSMEP